MAPGFRLGPGVPAAGRDRRGPGFAVAAAVCAQRGVAPEVQAIPMAASLATFLTVAMITKIVIRGIPSRYPNLKIINSHLGGALPMLVQRMDNQYRWQVPATPETPSIAAKRMTVRHRQPGTRACAALRM
jgi:aminocarboxymuconate-semialdehyde decarboxylase